MSLKKPKKLNSENKEKKKLKMEKESNHVTLQHVRLGKNSN